MKIYLLIICVLVSSFLPFVYGDGGHPCNLSVHSKIFPAYYEEHRRGNPDGSYIPGDAFYFLFEVNTSLGCVSYSAQSLNQHNNAMVVEMYSTTNMPTLNSYQWDIDYNDTDKDLIIYEKTSKKISHKFDSLDTERKEMILERGEKSGNVLNDIETYCLNKKKGECVWGRVEILASNNYSKTKESETCKEFDFDLVSLKKRVLSRKSQ